MMLLVKRFTYVMTVIFVDVLMLIKMTINLEITSRQLSVYDKAFLANELHKIQEERKALQQAKKDNVLPKKKREFL
ncbi:MAG: hypothetical protein ACRD5E_04235 [Nitrososphaeraceae archaeon]